MRLAPRHGRCPYERGFDTSVFKGTVPTFARRSADVHRTHSAKGFDAAFRRGGFDGGSAAGANTQSVDAIGIHISQRGQVIHRAENT